jgi:hypothetical protein
MAWPVLVLAVAQLGQSLNLYGFLFDFDEYCGVNCCIITPSIDGVNVSSIMITCSILLTGISTDAEDTD